MQEEFVSLLSEKLGLNLSEERTRTVAAQLGRIEEIAAALDAVELDPAADEMAPIWRP
jgi:Asp-tRNA(Asn)/Glu-tRNA(Gln) amidotransferase C subunit